MVWISSLHLWSKSSIGCHHEVFHSTLFWAHYPKYPNGVVCPISLWGSPTRAPEFVENFCGKPIVSYILCGSTAMHV
ncbi:hypothetical protein PITC_093010 [Penicillium italicum]|uniref:Uncharacterized protein n=1 Tax=Penicillium italicum TaxID=40296 RepID=A0A0A2LBD5_PENIT|nr:hypothetical protein PITC_093010 [Penicillium italicum]